MKQAIMTKYLGATDRRGARVKAVCEAGTMTVSWDYSISDEANHEFAALELASRYNWNLENKLVGGSLPKNLGYCFVLVSR